MNSARMGTLKSVVLAAFASCAANSHAAAQDGLNLVAIPAATVPPAAEGGGAGIAAVMVVVSLLVVIGVAVKFVDLRHKRESESVQLQAQVSDALLRDPLLAQLRLTPTAHVPWWTGSPATIEVSGQVPTPELKDTVLRIVRDEAARIRSDVQIEDHLSVVPITARAA